MESQAIFVPKPLRVVNFAKSEFACGNFLLIIFQKLQAVNKNVPEKIEYF